MKARRLTSCALLVAAALPAALHRAWAQTATVCTPASVPRPTLPAVIPFEMHSNHVVVRVCRGATPLIFTLDTGAGSSIFDLETAKTLGIEIGNPFRAGGAGSGTIAAAQITRDSVVIPGSNIPVPIGIAMDFSALNKLTGGRLQGIIGADFMNRYVVALDYRNREMHLYDHDTFHYTGTGTSVPFRIIGQFIRVNGEITLIDGTRLPIDCVIDVGSSLPLSIGRPFVEANQLHGRIGPSVRRPGGRGVGGVSDVDVGRIATLKIGEVAINRPVVQLHDDKAGVFSNNSLGEANIGGDVLRRYTVYFDYRTRRMIFEPHEGTNEPFEADMSGLALVPADDGQGLRVDFVLTGSPATEAGFRNGDLVTAVDGKPANSELLESLRVRFRKEHEDVSFTVRRDGADITLTLTTRRIV